MNNEFKGVVKYISNIEKVGEKQRPKQYVVLEETTDNDYPQSISVTFFGDKTDLVKDMILEKEYIVGYNLKCTESKGKHYTNINGWKVQPTQVSDKSLMNEKEGAPF